MRKKSGFTIVEQAIVLVCNTLRSFGYSHDGVETGAVAVLHTWGQNLSLHPHLHCIVPAAGYAPDGSWKNIGASGKYQPAYSEHLQ